MDVFTLRDRLIADYASYITSFVEIRDRRIDEYVQERLQAGVLWPEPLIQLNPSFQSGDWIDDLVAEGVLHPECRDVFRIKPNPDGTETRRLRLHRHQSDAVRTAPTGANYVLTTGTGSGKSLAYIVPIVDHVLRRGSRRGIQAIVVYPMNALANSQYGELEKFLHHGYADGRGPVTFKRYTGQENDLEKQAIIANPPDILLTNYVMLELILTRPQEEPLIRAAQGLRFLVLDELHTYRGRQGADVALLVRRTRDRLNADRLQCVGTSATLAGPGTYDEQRAEVARVATILFGDEVKPQNVIGETLQRATPGRDVRDPAFVADLAARLSEPIRHPPTDWAGFLTDPLSSWIETTFGLQQEPGTGRLVRARPRSLTGPDGAAGELADLIGVPVERCAQVLQGALLGGYRVQHPETGFPAFAFRLHQFISRGDTIYGSLEPEDERYLTLDVQQYVPGSRSKILLPLVFCRECGQEYYCVRLVKDRQTGERFLVPRELSDRLDDGEGEAGFLHLSTEAPWPTEPDQVVERLPDDWLEERRGELRAKREHKRDLPELLRVTTDGRVSSAGELAHFMRAPFVFCLNGDCRVEYSSRQTSDFGKLATLSSEGRSTATTVLSLSAILALREDDTLPERARKLLSFTDNRQDASLQAGHFNDFVEIGLLRSALYRAVEKAGPAGLRYDELAQKVYEALELPLEAYAADPGVRYQALNETRRAFCNVLGYRLYRDLRRGWRITSPNLEQTGLLDIRYPSLDELCANEDDWADKHAALATASPATRAAVARTLLNVLRRGLAIKVDYLGATYQERIKQQSSARLIPPWGFDENENLEHAAILYPRSRRLNDYRGNLYLSTRSSFGQLLRRSSTFADYREKITLDETEQLIRDLLAALKIAGLVEVVEPARGPDDVPGYQVPASALEWVVGEGKRAFVDPMRTLRTPTAGGRANPFFVEFYRTRAAATVGLEAREHTAQVPYEQREDREERFKTARLPILYCSPTMELGVDIAELNVVNLRNVPPTPANYAQRSGRAGRSGQPALVFSYCSTFRSHDQYFFRRPELMVAGAVAPPRLDLANEDLVRAHVQAIWLAETGLSLGRSLKDLLDLTGDQPSLALQEHVRDALADSAARRRARERSQQVLATVEPTLQAAGWWHPDWLDEVLNQLSPAFEAACERWRGLYRAARGQMDAQHRLIQDASRTPDARDEARRLRREAEAQLELLIAEDEFAQSDFYSYRYFASEGFLPGYSFPRLPLSAFIPARLVRSARRRDEFLSRSRFLAISEFGPRAVVYHEGSRYVINKVILPVGDQDLLTSRAKQCHGCGYVHPIADGDGPDTCEQCRTTLRQSYRNLFRLQNVSTRRRDKITSDEEERLRLGYDLKTGVRFAEHRGRVDQRVGTAAVDGEALAELTYGHTATIWRINLGWRRRANKDQLGFLLDTERGYWARNEQLGEDDPQDPLSNRQQRVIPYVEDRRNCLLLRPTDSLEAGQMASLQAALKHAVEAVYQLEDAELAAEPLPDEDNRHLVLFYEAAEGGAGVLRQLLDDPGALAVVAAEALRICHFDPDTGDDLRRAPRATEDCEAACYDCLMSYNNQRDHALLDRQAIRDLLLRLAAASVSASPAPVGRSEHLAALERQCASDLERAWLRYLDERGYHLPDRAQPLFERCGTRPDFAYDDRFVVVYVDGPHHEYPERRARDAAQTECMEDDGYSVIRFGRRDDWSAILDRHPNLFGRPS